jgi:hypothetical protein
MSLDEFNMAYANVFGLNSDTKEGLVALFFLYNQYLYNREAFNRSVKKHTLCEEKEDTAFITLIKDKFDIKGTEDEVRLIKASLRRIYNTIDGRKLLEALSGTPKIKILKNIENIMRGAAAIHKNHRIELLYSGDSETLFHELVHELQEQNKVQSQNGLSSDDAFFTNIMQELDARINTTCFELQNYLQNDPKELNRFKDDKESDLGFLYHEYLKLKQEHPNKSDDELIYDAKKALSIALFS